MRTDSQHPFNNQKILLINLATLLLITGAVVFLLAWSLDLDIASFLTLLIKKIYRPHVNVVNPLYLLDRPLYAYYYLIIACSFVCLATFRLLFPFRSASQQRSNYSLLIQLSFLMLIITVPLQMSGQMFYHLKEYHLVSNKPLDQKQLSLATGNIYALARHYKKILPGKRSTLFVTDLNIENDPGMLQHRVLAYHLYPIDIRQIRKEPIDSLLMFHKNNAIQSVPDEFKVIDIVNDRNLIAIKKPNPQNP